MIERRNNSVYEGIIWHNWGLNTHWFSTIMRHFILGIGEAIMNAFQELIDFFFFCWVDELFNIIKQSLLLRILSNHCPISFKSGVCDFLNHISNLKIDGWMLKGLRKRRKTSGILLWSKKCQIILSCKLKLLKTKLKEWNASNSVNLKKNKSNLLN